jgi:hypothetical protein
LFRLTFARGVFPRGNRGKEAVGRFVSMI